MESANKRRRIALLCRDLSVNCAGRVHILAQVLQPEFDVRVIGPASDGQLWEPLRPEKDVQYIITEPASVLAALHEYRPEIIYASKPMMASFGFALIASWRTKVPLLLDIDDWEIGLYGSFGSKVRSAVRFWKLDGYLLAVVMDRLARHRQNVTVSNSFLLARYGGVLVPHFRDTSQFDPNRYDQEEEKGRLGLKGRHVILFLGTPRPHKGLLELIEAVGQLRRDDLVLLLVGAGEGDCKALPEKSFLRIIGRQPFHTVPRFLAAADLIVLFQSNSSAARGQLPAKLFDAMSMAKPIIASAVSDLPDILDNCGEVTVPGDVDGLVERIQTLLDNPDYAHELGARAREKCVAHYSFVAVAPRVHAVIEEMLDSSHPTEKLSRRARASSVVLARCRRELRKDGG